MKNDHQQELINFLKDIDQHLQEMRLQSKVNLFVFGGAAAVLGYRMPRGTMDLDVHLKQNEIELELIAWAGQGSDLEKKHGLYLQSANTTLMAIDPDWMARSKEILKDTFKILKVRVLSKEDLIISKLSRYNNRDRADIQFLTENHKVDQKKLLKYYRSARSYYVGDLRTLDTAFNIILKEHFEMKTETFE